MTQSDQYSPKSLLAPLMVPLFIVIAMWIVFLIEFETGISLSHYGLKPRTASGLLGIFTIPFLHGGWSHLINNSIPMLILGWALFKFYPTLAVKTLIWIYLMSGIWLWISGRPSFHIGASGIVYGLAAFLFLSGWLRREKRVAALSLLVAFLYGGMWWGVLPVDPTISWEGHFWGALAGFILAVVYRKKGPQKPVYQWEKDEEQEELDILESNPDIEDIEFEEISVARQQKPSVNPIVDANPTQIRYSFKPNPPTEKPES